MRVLTIFSMCLLLPACGLVETGLTAATVATANVKAVNDGNVRMDKAKAAVEVANKQNDAINSSLEQVSKTTTTP